MEGASNASQNHLTFRNATQEDAESISAMAREIWEAIYPSIISHDQIEYMLEWMYNPDKLRSEMDGGGVTYIFVDQDKTSIGYLAYSDEGDHFFLHKIYLKPGCHGRGLGSASLNWLIEQCAQAGATCIRLRVNKENAAAMSNT